MANRLVSGELNDSVAPVDADMVDSFLDHDEAANKASVIKGRKSGRPQSAYESFRKSSHFSTMNKFGESRKILHDDDDAAGVVSVKMRQSQKIEKLGTFAAAASIFKAFVGLGILFLPMQFDQTGIVAMPLIMIASLCLTLYCTTLLIECADSFGNEFTEIAFAAYGGWAKKLTQILIICSQSGFCINYVYFICSQIGAVINCINNGDDPNCSNYMVVKDAGFLWYFFPALFCIYVPLCWIRDLEKLAWSHLLGNILILIVVFSVMGFSTSNLVTEGPSVQPVITKYAAKAIPYSAFAFEGVAVVMPIREIVEDKAGYMKLVTIVVASICVLYVVFAEYSVLAYGDQTGNITVLDNLPATNPATYTLKILYTVNLFFSYPMQLSPAFDIIESFIFPHDKKATKGQYWCQNLIRAAWVAFTIVAALLIYPYISVFIEVIAAATCSPLAFTLPALFHYKLMGGNKAHLFIAIATTILTIYMVTTAIRTLVIEINAPEE